MIYLCSDKWLKTGWMEVLIDNRYFWVTESGLHEDLYVATSAKAI